MTATTRLADRRPDPTKVLLVGSWLLYALAFLPFEVHKTYTIEWVFTIVALVGLLLVLMTVNRPEMWRRVGVAAAVVLLLTYVVYWFFLAGKVEANKPELGFGSLLFHAGQDVVDIIRHRLATGAIWAAVTTAYLEFVMPVLQLVLLIVLLAKGRRS
jgi:hypothetical protein